PLFPSYRFLTIFLAFLGAVFNYVTRVNLSVAVVCMVRDKSCGSSSSSSNNITATSIITNISNISNSGDGGTCSETGEFDWDKATTGRLLAMYFYGYLFLQIPGGWLASRYGGARVWGVCQTVCAVCTLLTPVCARTSVQLTYALRFILGFAAGVTFPCIHAMHGKWSPPLERTRMASVTFSGPLIGSILAFSISGLLCEYGFDNGWGSIFYIAGIGNLLWVVAWFWLVTDTPDQHKRISHREREYINASFGKANTQKVKTDRIPWVSVFTSGSVWAIVIVHMTSSYLNYTLLTSLPTFMKESLDFDIKANGLLSSLPYICQFSMVPVFGHVADRMRERKIMSTKNVRKLFQCIGASAVCYDFVISNYPHQVMDYAMV
ncbi:vesicular glutamate transporter 1, partial [Elysia marginata]